jgi:hypothetical protein
MYVSINVATARLACLDATELPETIAGEISIDREIDDHPNE